MACTPANFSFHFSIIIITVITIIIMIMVFNLEIKPLIYHFSFVVVLI